MTHASATSSWSRDLGFGFLAIVAVAATSVVGQFAAYPNLAPWYTGVIATIVAFYRIDRMAGWCLVPLAAWVCFATVLNFAIWKLNS